MIYWSTSLLDSLYSGWTLFVIISYREKYSLFVNVCLIIFLKMWSKSLFSWRRRVEGPSIHLCIYLSIYLSIGGGILSIQHSLISILFQTIYLDIKLSICLSFSPLFSYSCELMEDQQFIGKGHLPNVKFNINLKFLEFHQ